MYEEQTSKIRFVQIYNVQKESHKKIMRLQKITIMLISMIRNVKQNFKIIIKSSKQIHFDCFYNNESTHWIQ